MIERSITLTFDHKVVFTRNAFSPENSELARILTANSLGDRPSRALVVLDRAVAEAKPELVGQIESYFESSDPLQLAGPVAIFKGGESCKNDPTRVTDLWKLIHEAGLDRHSYVLAIGGGALLDLVGFAASTAHRGIRHVRFPTTTLSQGDGGVGVKNGINFFGKKNWIGTFTIPTAVINDLEFLDTQPENERRAGIIEAIKVALIRCPEFFQYIEDHTDALAALDPKALEHIVRRSAELHVEHITTSGDPFELGSARPLDFGHWVAHKLEQLSRFRIGHGNAVAIGIAVDLLYSVEAGILEAETCGRILSVILRIGFPIFEPELIEVGESGELAVLEGLEEFREHLGGELTITLVPKIGSKIEVHKMDRTAILVAIEALRVGAEATA